MQNFNRSIRLSMITIIVLILSTSSAWALKPFGLEWGGTEANLKTNNISTEHKTQNKGIDIYTFYIGSMPTAFYIDEVHGLQFILHNVGVFHRSNNQLGIAVKAYKRGCADLVKDLGKSAILYEYPTRKNRQRPDTVELWEQMGGHIIEARTTFKNSIGGEVIVEIKNVGAEIYVVRQIFIGPKWDASLDRRDKE